MSRVFPSNDVSVGACAAETASARKRIAVMTASASVNLLSFGSAVMRRSVSWEDRECVFLNYIIDFSTEDGIAMPATYGLRVVSLVGLEN